MTTMTLHEPRTGPQGTTGLGPRPADRLDYRVLADPLADIELDDLIRHITICHHRYARETVALVQGWLQILIARHSARHPELADLQTVFGQLAAELLAAMTREEHEVFPAIRALAVARRHHDAVGEAPYLTIGDAIGLVDRQDAVLEGLMMQIRTLTHRFRVPADGCLTYRLCYEELERFATDLARHVYLEKRILYPRAVALAWLAG